MVMAFLAHVMTELDKMVAGLPIPIECDTDSALTHCGLVTPYGDTDLGQHWLR